MAKVRERQVKVETMDCYCCGERYTQFERKNVVYQYQWPEPVLVESMEQLWNLASGLMQGGQVYCPGCEEVISDDYDVWEEGQTVYECAACEAWWTTEEEARGCC